MTKFDRFQPSLFEFLEQLADNNNRPWFLENKPRYERDVLEPALAFIRAFEPRLKKISPYFVASDRRVGGSLMRVYRDTRFHKDGEPYKTNVGIQFRHEQGRDIHAPGFYVHIAPGECFLAVGLWRPEPEALGQGPAGDRRVARPLAAGPRRPEVPPAVLPGRRQPEASAPRLPGRPSVRRGSEADGLHRGRRAGGEGRARQGIPGPRGRFLRRQPALHAVPVRGPEGAVLRLGHPLATLRENREPG